MEPIIESSKPNNPSAELADQKQLQPTDEIAGHLDNDSNQLSREEQLHQDELLAAKLSLEEEPEASCSSDIALAMILQRQFDLEYNQQLNREEARLNGKSKVGVSLDKFRRSTSHMSNHLDDDENDYDDSKLEQDQTETAWDSFEQREIKQRSRMMGRSGFVFNKDGTMTTKHDIPTSSRKNMCRLMESKGDIKTGDAGATKDDFMITNYVYNKLKVHSSKSSKKANQKLFERREPSPEGRAQEDCLASLRMNESTKTIIDALLTGYRIEKLNGIIGHGKESSVLHATGRDNSDVAGQELAIKIFKSDMGVAFKTRDTYNKSKCPSFKFDKPKSKHDSLNKWAERGFKNLKILRKHGINCPEAISLKKHVLVMSFIGTDASPSPQLRNASLNELQLRKAYEQVLDIMVRMYRDCQLIHGDLSEYNLLWHDDTVYVIDVSQSMFCSHPGANRFLYRDCKNILNFFKRSGVTDVMEENSLFTMISGNNLRDYDVETWCRIEDFPKNEKLMLKDENSNKKKPPKLDSFAQIFSRLPSDHIDSSITVASSALKTTECRE